MTQLKTLNRRQFMAITGRSGGALILGCSLGGLGLSGNASAKPIQPKSDGTGQPLGAFVTIKENGDIDIICHRAEMGQGILTSVPQIIAEELGADWSKVNAVLGNADPKYGDQNTGGSASIRRHFLHIRQMGASARELLKQAAANKWGVEKSKVKALNHQVVYGSKQLGYGELAADAAKLPLPEISSLKLKDSADYTLIGKEDIALQGLEKIVTGEATYAQDVQLPGMLLSLIHI